ncbi:hypothetical protein FB45DRAFT_1067930 [Roridomyces roridus]|uniref:DUF1365-domain-containing protein n=1 Tax=Roridomyces roridus TaxID=1738132 RepID=A0AAD7F9Z4_9AGAR|nr:hypothetical protein FB45DRAFT_1067930 [Roridomyces roridus]
MLSSTPRSLLVSLNALESHSLDLGWHGWHIRATAGRWGRLVGLRPKPYLTDTPEGSIRERLEKVLRDRGFGGQLEDAWMMTMPSLLGFEGINPLTVYFCYRPGGRFFLTVLEVHNTFGESHVYCLETGKHEDKTPSRGFDHQWTFPRAFHVSPFNDRSGFYTVSIKAPTHPPTGHSDGETSPPRPSVRVHLLTPTDDPIPAPGALKLTALLRPTSATPLSSASLLYALSRAPFDLFLSFARILYVAWILHYKKRLDVFIRPEPFPVSATDPMAGGVRWIEAGFFERYAQRQVSSFLLSRVEETGVSVTLLPPSPTHPSSSFSPAAPEEGSPSLTITYLSPRLFTILLLCPSAAHALLLGKTEHIFSVDSEPLFLAIFAAPAPPPGRPLFLSRRQRVRSWPVPRDLPLDIPAKHALDVSHGSLWGTLVSTLVVCTLLFMDRVEEWIFRLLRARLVPGVEPWKQWERAGSAYRGDKFGPAKEPLGSVRRD